VQSDRGANLTLLAFPSVDSIAEFNVLRSNYLPENGRSSGAEINVITRGGTNQFHGDAYEFFRNDVLNANSWDNNFNGAPKKKLRWNEFGGTLGGPIVRDKLFFFVDYQGQRFDTPTSTSATSVFTPAERAGNFSELLQGSSPVQLYNPYVLNAAGQRVPFAGNIIPANLLNPVAQNIVNSSVYPLPTSPGLINNYLYSTHTAINGDQGDAKIDWNASEKDRLFGRFSRSLIDNPSTNNMPLFYNGFAIYPTWNGVLDWVRTISPSVINDARFGINYVLVNNGAAANGVGNFPQTVGLPGIPSSILPAMNFSGGNAATVGNADIYQLFADTVIQYEDTMTINMGPQHPSTHGVLRLILTIEGETVVKAVPDIGFLHTGIEKTAESKTYYQALVLTDRTEYLSPLYNNLAYSLSVERLLGIEDEINDKIKYARVLLGELTRIASHLVWLGTHALDLGAQSVFLYCFREREMILDVFEELSGVRMMTSYICPGGLQADLTPGFDARVRAFTSIFPQRLQEYHDLLTNNQLWVERTKGVGVLSKEDAIAYGASGPVLRGSNVVWDIRKAYPYSGYEKFDFDIPVGTNGDVYDRYLVRMLEMEQSLNIVNQALEGMPTGAYRVPNPKI